MEIFTDRQFLESTARMIASQPQSRVQVVEVRMPRPTGSVVELAKPYLDAAVSIADITVQLVERSGYQSVVLYSTHSDEEITKATYGYHFPLHAGSKGQVLLY